MRPKRDSRVPSHPAHAPQLEPGLGDVVRVGLILTIAILVVLVGSSILFSATPGADLSGVWQLDTDLSDDPVEKVREAAEGRSRAAGGSWGAGSGVGGGRLDGSGRGGGIGMGGGRGSAADRSREGIEERLRRQHQRFESLEIRQQTDGSLSLVFGDGTIETFTTDGKKNDIERQGHSVEVQAKWKRDALMVTSRSSEQQSVETYQITGDRKLLRVRVELTLSGAGRPDGPVALQRLYRPMTATPPPPSSPAEDGDGSSVVDR